MCKKYQKHLSVMRRGSVMPDAEQGVQSEPQDMGFYPRVLKNFVKGAF